MRIDLVFPVISKRFSSITQEEADNSFLKTRKGLKYLLLKYPNLSLISAIKEYKNQSAATTI